jgi:hypothetical protein
LIPHKTAAVLKNRLEGGEEVSVEAILKRIRPAFGGKGQHSEDKASIRRIRPAFV